MTLNAAASARLPDRFNFVLRIRQAGRTRSRWPGAGIRFALLLGLGKNKLAISGAVLGYRLRFSVRLALRPFWLGNQQNVG
jgi:hypothetical protein